MTAEQIATEGLTTAEADDRRRRGEANTAVSGTSRSYATILRTNVFSFYNTILFVIGVALLALGRYSDALISVGLGLVNAMISAVQEIRAKRKLDRLQLLDRAPVLVVRDGREVEVAPDAVVRGDVLRVRAGRPDRGRRAAARRTAGSRPTSRCSPASPTRSSRTPATTCGRAASAWPAAATSSPATSARHSYAGRLTAEARRVTTDKTPLQRRIEFVVRLVIALIVLMSGAILAQAALEGFSLLRVVQTTAVLSGLVPYGLFFLIAVAYTAGAARIAGRGALVQQVNAVESVSNVDVVCTDKTGTLTTGRLTLAEVEPVGGARRRAAARVPSPAASPPRTSPPRRWPRRCPASGGPSATRCRSRPRCAGPGSSPTTARGCSAPRTRSPRTSPARPSTPRLDSTVAARTALGLRVLVLARAADPSAGLRDAAGRPALPALEPVAVVALADELRPEVAETIARFRGTGSRSRCSPATTRAPSPRSPPRPD